MLLQQSLAERFSPILLHGCCSEGVASLLLCHAVQLLLKGLVTTQPDLRPLRESLLLCLFSLDKP